MAADTSQHPLQGGWTSLSRPGSPGTRKEGCLGSAPAPLGSRGPQASGDVDALPARPALAHPRASSGPTEVTRPGLRGHHWGHREGTDARVTFPEFHVGTLSLATFAPTSSSLPKHKALYVTATSHVCSALGSLMQDGGMTSLTPGSTHE